MKGFLRGEYIALKKDFGAGVILILTIGVILLLIQVVMKVLAPIVLITNNELFQILLSLGIILILGLLSRKLKENEKTAWLVDFLPSKSMDQPEMIFWHEEKYCSGILIGYREIKTPGGITIKFAEISEVNIGPTGISMLSPKFISVLSEDLQPTGRKLKDVAKRLATLGTIPN
ncbi:MAG: hypothetical protein WC099_00175 [Candidatus Paceibacterota bacterium]